MYYVVLNCLKNECEPLVMQIVSVVVSVEKCFGKIIQLKISYITSFDFTNLSKHQRN